jgi:FRG domain
VPFPEDYWENYQETITTLEEYIGRVSAISETWPERRFVWRGVANADYALHSSLYRRVRNESRTTERQLRLAEDAIIEEARDWWLQRNPIDRLSALELLAALQHQGVPTRLIDFSHNALVGLWFAVEEKRDENGRDRPDTDGRVFVAQSNGREIDRTWERRNDIPWRGAPEDWSRDIYIWTPPPIDPRMTRQQGCFVVGGVPTTEGGWNRSPGGTGLLGQAAIRSCVSVGIRLNHPGYMTSAHRPGRPPQYPLAFTLLIPADAKPALRRVLVRGLGMTHAMMYLDYPGFAAFAHSIPRP